jgi:tRNA modification GTPase
MEDTIAAIATPAGYGGIAIVKISGPEAFAIVDGMFLAADGKDMAQKRPASVNYGRVMDGDRLVDEVLVSKMSAPATYTRENVAEINCHGGFVAADEILALALALGARPAEPGEFTKRAFLNGRIDLTQAEAVSDMIMAKTRLAGRAAASRLSGSLKRSVDAASSALANLMVRVEASIEYPEYEDVALEDAFVKGELERVSSDVEKLIESFRRASILREGMSVVICGKPNVGKSMLLNTLLERDRSIVTPIAGTTRDVVDDWINLDGIPVRLFDTAGIRTAADEIERVGVERSREAIGSADLVVFVVDGSSPLDEEDRQIYDSLDPALTVVVVNKADVRTIEATASAFPSPITLSAATRANLGELIEAIKLAGALDEAPSEALVSKARHRDCLERANSSINAAIAASANGVEADLLEIDLRDALDQLGAITGVTTSEDIVEAIFREFCVGK